MNTAISPTQFDLFAPPRARRRDPVTSHEAAARVREFDGEHYVLILDALKSQGPQTIYELAVRTRLSHVQIARRLPELKSGNLVATTDDVRPGPTGRNCRVWRLA